ncbi:MAG: hypothetical protein ACRDGV_11145 [Candidatus Limnocylindria bacterium]
MQPDPPDPSEPYEPPRGRSALRWLTLAAGALLVTVALVVMALGGLGIFSPGVPTPAPTPTTQPQTAGLPG